MVKNIDSIKSVYPFKNNFIKLKGYNYHYIDEGDKSAEPILMLHGNPTWSFYYRRLISEFSGSYRTVAPDHLGCGLSDKPQDFNYCLENHIDNIEELVVHLDLTNINLVVHDWGGAIGLGFAIRHPRRIKRLVIMNSSAFSMRSIPLRIALCRSGWLGEKLVRSANMFCRMAIHMAVENRLDKVTKKGLLLPYDSYENRVAIHKFIEDIPMGPEDRSYEVLLAIEHGLWMFREIPVFLMWGMEDWCFNGDFLEKWKLFYPESKVLAILDAGHYVLEDAYDKIIPQLKSFLRKVN